MTWHAILLQEATRAKSPWLIVMVMAAVIASRLVGADPGRLRPLVFFATMHGGALALLVGLIIADSDLVSAFRLTTWLCAAVAFVGAASVLLFSVTLPKVRVQVPRILQDVIIAIGSLVACVGVATNAGLNLSGLIATSAVFTAIIGFSLQDTIGNIAGGLGLQVDNSVEVGDWVRVGTSPADVTGRVVEIRWRYTAIETRNWETVLVPNRVLMNSQVMVLGRRIGHPRLWRRTVIFHVDWRHAPSDVLDTVHRAFATAQLDRVAVDPSPNCILLDMAETFGRYALRYWLTDLAADDSTDSDVRQRIFVALERENIKLAMPAHALFVSEENAEREQRKVRRKLARRRQLLDGVPLFALLSDEERETLALHLKHVPFATGEIVTRAGDAADCLYIVEEGVVSVRSEGEREVARLGPKEIFGEMSLLTGAPRAATVVATTNVECFRLEKSALQETLDRRPKLADDLAELLVQRRAALDATKGEVPRQPESEKPDLVERIRRYFRLS